jgi:hypothetical protein
MHSAPALWRNRLLVTIATTALISGLALPAFAYDDAGDDGGGGELPDPAEVAVAQVVPGAPAVVTPGPGTQDTGGLTQEQRDAAAATREQQIVDTGDTEAVEITGAPAAAGEPSGDGTSPDHPPTVLPLTDTSDCEGDCYRNEPETQFTAAPQPQDTGDAEGSSGTAAGDPGGIDCSRRDCYWNDQPAEEHKDQTGGSNDGPGGSSQTPAESTLTPEQQEAAAASSEAQDLLNAENGGTPIETGTASGPDGDINDKNPPGQVAGSGPAGSGPAGSDPANLADPDDQQGQQNPFRAAEQQDQQQAGWTGIGTVTDNGFLGCDNYLGKAFCDGAEQALGLSYEVPAEPGQDGEDPTSKLCDGLDANSKWLCEQALRSTLIGVPSSMLRRGEVAKLPTCEETFGAELCAVIDREARRNARPPWEIVQKLLNEPLVSPEDPDAVTTGPVAAAAPVADCDGQYIVVVKNWDSDLACDLARSGARVSQQAADAGVNYLRDPSTATAAIESAKVSVVLLEESIRLLTSPWGVDPLGPPGAPMWPSSGGSGAGTSSGAKPAPGRGGPSPAGTDPVDPPAGPDER